VLEFDRERKSMSVLVSNGAADAAVGTLLVKGATEMVLSR
jgi:magnesium-transporting ATPase (P-type)